MNKKLPVFLSVFMAFQSVAAVPSAALPISAGETSSASQGLPDLSNPRNSAGLPNLAVLSGLPGSSGLPDRSSLPGVQVAAAGAAQGVQPSQAEVAVKLEHWANLYNIPPVLLKAIAWMESGWRQFDAGGNVILSPDGAGIGIMQITTYDKNDAATVQKLKTDIDYNIECGCRLLNEKWRMFPKIGNGDRNVLENWYFAAWGYNCWLASNNPNNPDGKKSKAYQDMIFSLMGQKYNSTITFAPGATVIPKESLPPVNPPDLNSLWETPQSTHKGDLQINIANLVSAGGYNGDASGDYWYESGTQNSYYALGFYVTAYDGAQDGDKPALLQKISLCYDNLLSSADKILADPNVTDASLDKAAKYYWTVLQGPAAGSSYRDRANAGLTKCNQNKAIHRLYGERAEDTAIALSQTGWATADNVVLARVDAFPDALAGAPLAKKLNAPVLLTSPDALDPKVLAEIKRLGAKKVYILGGEGAVKPAVEKALAAYAPERIFGQTAEDTAVVIARRLGPTDKAVIASAAGFADALSVSAPAAALGIPILLTAKEGPGAETLDYLKEAGIKQTLIIGGTAVIGAAVDQAGGALAPYGPVRLAGWTQYDTMLDVVKYFNQDTNNLFVATGENFPDGLAGGALAARLGGPLILVGKNQVAPDTLSYLNGLRGKKVQVYILGGPGALSPDLDSALAAALQ